MRVHLRNLRFALIVLIALCAKPVSPQSLCQFYQNGELFDLSEIYRTTQRFVMKQTNQTYEIYLNLCSEIDQNHIKEYKEEQLEGAGSNINSIVVDIQGKNYTILTRSGAGWKKTVWLKKRTGFGPATNLTSIDITHEIDNVLIKSLLNLSRIRYSFTCDALQSAEFHTIFHQSETKELVLIYTGPKSCPLVIKDYISFLSRNVGFLAILFASSLIGMFLKRSNERLLMSLTSLQAAVMITTALCITFDAYINQDNGEYYLSIAAFSAGMIAFGFSYFSRMVAVLFVCVSLSYSISWTLLYVVTVAFRLGVDSVVFLSVNGAVLAAILVSSISSQKLREKYSYGIYTSITYPFFLCLSVSIYFKQYLDVITFNKYRDWGREDNISWKTWIGVPVQIAISFALAYSRCVRDFSDRSEPVRVSGGLSSPMLKQKLVFEENSSKTIISM
jgi:hypothetical protein